MLESGRGTSPARAAAARMSEASTVGWSRHERHARSSGDSAAAGNVESGARSGISTTGHRHHIITPTDISVIGALHAGLCSPPEQLIMGGWQVGRIW